MIQIALDYVQLLPGNYACGNTWLSGLTRGERRASCAQQSFDSPHGIEVLTGRQPGIKVLPTAVELFQLRS
jgi:hypothetical protein